MAMLNPKYIRPETDQNKPLQCKKKLICSPHEKGSSSDFETSSSNVLLSRAFGMNHYKPEVKYGDTKPSTTSTGPGAGQVVPLWQDLCTDTRLKNVLEFSYPIGGSRNKVVTWTIETEGRSKEHLEKRLSNRLARAAKHKLLEQAVKAGFGPYKGFRMLGDYSPACVDGDFTSTSYETVKSDLPRSGVGYVLSDIREAATHPKWRDAISTYRSVYRDLYFERYGDSNMSHPYEELTLELEMKSEMLLMPLVGGDTDNRDTVFEGDPGFDEGVFDTSVQAANDNEIVQKAQDDISTDSRNIIKYLDADGSSLSVEQFRKIQDMKSKQSSDIGTGDGLQRYIGRHQQRSLDLKVLEMAWDRKCKDPYVGLSLMPSEFAGPSVDYRRRLFLDKADLEIPTRATPKPRYYNRVESNRLGKSIDAWKRAARRIHVRRSIAQVEHDKRPVSDLYGYRAFKGPVQGGAVYTRHYPKNLRNSLDSAIETCDRTSRVIEQCIVDHILNDDYASARRLACLPGLGGNTPVVKGAELSEKLGVVGSDPVPRSDSIIDPVSSNAQSNHSKRLGVVYSQLLEESPEFMGPPKPSWLKTYGLVVCENKILMPEDIDLDTLDLKTKPKYLNPYKGKFYICPSDGRGPKGESEPLILRAMTAIRESIMPKKGVSSSFRYNVFTDKKGRVMAIPQIRVI